MSALDRRVLLTGANGFVGSHILAQLLDAGFYVRAVVRSQAKADTVQRDHPTAGQNLDTAVVEDITVPGAFDAVLQAQPALDTVIHTASPFLYSVANDPRDFLDPAVKGTVELLNSVKKTAPSVKRVIITSSFAAVGDFSQIPDAGKTYTGADWNPITWEEALATKDWSVAYRASKKFAEKAGELDARPSRVILTSLAYVPAWDFVEQEKPGFDLVALNPPMVYGSLRHTIASIAQLNESNLRIWRLFLDTSKDADIPPNGLPLYVDVRVSHASLTLCRIRRMLNK